MEETLFNDFQALPETIKTWLASDHCAIYISEINKKLGIKGNRRSIIPTLTLRLVTQDLAPQDFIQELADNLNVGYPIAKSLTEEIEAKILHPIELGLRRDAGVDIKLIYLEEAGAKPIPPITAAPTPPKPAPTPIIHPTPPSIPPISKVPAPASPIQPITAELPAEEKSAIAPRVIYHERAVEEAPMPVFQAAPTVNKPEIRPVSARIVHYSNLITPLTSPKAENDNPFFDSYIVDLRKI